MVDPVAERLAAIRARTDRATPPPWDVDDHHHLQDGCKCGSCYDVVGWLVDHPKALACDDRVAARSVTGGEKNEFGRELRHCDSLDPLLSWEDADFAAHARADVPDLLDALEAVLKLADEAEPGLSSPPADCTNSCYSDPCDCSGNWQARAWKLDPEAIRKAVADVLSTDTKETARD